MSLESKLINVPGRASTRRSYQPLLAFSFEGHQIKSDLEANDKEKKTFRASKMLKPRSNNKPVPAVAHLSLDSLEGCLILDGLH